MISFLCWKSYCTRAGSKTLLLVAWSQAVHQPCVSYTDLIAEGNCCVNRGLSLRPWCRCFFALAFFAVTQWLHSFPERNACACAGSKTLLLDAWSPSSSSIFCSQCRIPTLLQREIIVKTMFWLLDPSSAWLFGLPSIAVEHECICFTERNAKTLCRFNDSTFGCLVPSSSRFFVHSVENWSK